MGMERLRDLKRLQKENERAREPNAKHALTFNLDQFDAIGAGEVVLLFRTVTLGSTHYCPV
ncbi:hypothetical protein [Roseibium algae]|uniref:Uncharacterized protein n=1 Tax=Roseibium algae TaxID=3123038 RepID=A0ABU8TF52_9HYPH